MKKNIKFWSLLFLLGSFAIFSGCSDDDEPTGSTDAATARFSYEVDADNYLKVTFTNESVNADTYAWDFGDGNSSTDESPVHTFAEVGTFTVMLTATGTGFAHRVATDDARRRRRPAARDEYCHSGGTRHTVCA